MDVLIVGGGIGGLTLTLTLHQLGIRARVYEAAPEIRGLGVGVNLLPPAARELCGLGLEPALTEAAILAREAVFFNRYGQLIYREPLGRFAGNRWPQFSIHRGDLQTVLLNAVVERLGADAVRAGWKCVGVSSDADGATALFEDARTGAALDPQRGSVVVGCDGIHSVVRKQLHAKEHEPIYSGINMWRGVTVWPPILSGASMIRAGWFTPAKLVAYPIRDNVDGQGRQLVNWLIEMTTPDYERRDWNRRGHIEDFIDAIADWRFDWLDVPAFVQSAELVLEFPMVDQDPLPWWSLGRVTLLGDAAHPMYPRGSNGAGQAILDARTLADCLATHANAPDALAAYEAQRLPATAAVVSMNRTNPPDAILREVYVRTGDKPFGRIEDVIAADELAAILNEYRRVTTAVGR